MKDKITVSAPAKINLTLNIGKLREDNYHEVNMIMQAVSLKDTIVISKNARKEIKIFCDTQGVPLDSTNLVYKAAVAFFSAANRQPEGLDIYIEKRIPIQAGLAGGSTDCAAALYGINALYGYPISNENLKNIGAGLGADVPFCFDGGTALATGKGTDIKSLCDMPECYIVLVKPNINVSTKEAYQKADSRTLYRENVSLEMISALNSGEYNKICSLLHNDFYDILNIDDVKHIIDLMKSLGSDGACMSGSGPTVFGLFQKEALAQDATEALKRKYSQVYLCKPISYGVKTENIE